MYLVVGYRTLKHAVNEKARRELSIEGSATAIDRGISVGWGAVAVTLRIGRCRVDECNRDVTTVTSPNSLWCSQLLRKLTECRTKHQRNWFAVTDCRLELPVLGDIGRDLHGSIMVCRLQDMNFAQPPFGIDQQF